MKNVYDIKKDKKLLWALPEEMSMGNLCNSMDVLIVVHLHYLDRVEYYLEYLSRFKGNYRIVISSSNEELIEYIKQNISKVNVPIQVIKKANRGRDISALLVATREEICKSEYVCFVHDKREKKETLKDDNDRFVECMWKNLLGSELYVQNILHIFESNHNVGVLLPPEPYTRMLNFVQKNTWDKDFELMKDLATRLNLNCNLSEEKKPISLGTAFWARTDALRKLLNYEWKYADFDEEPLAGDGTISHAIERCFPYVAQDAGYDTGIVMTQKYSATRFFEYEETIAGVFAFTREYLNIESLSQLKWLRIMSEKILEFAGKYNSIYIYGAGGFAKRIVKLLSILEVQPYGIIVSDMENQSTIANIPMTTLEEHNVTEEQGIIVAVGQKYQDEILSNLMSHGVSHNQILRCEVVG